MLLLRSLRQRRWSSVSASLSRFTRSSRVPLIAASFLCPQRGIAVLLKRSATPMPDQHGNHVFVPPDSVAKHRVLPVRARWGLPSSTTVRLTDVPVCLSYSDVPYRCRTQRAAHSREASWKKDGSCRPSTGPTRLPALY